MWFLTVRKAHFTLYICVNNVFVSALIFPALQSKVSHQLKFNTAIPMHTKTEFSAHVSGRRRQTTGWHRKYKPYLAAVFSPVYPKYPYGRMQSCSLVLKAATAIKWIPVSHLRKIDPLLTPDSYALRSIVLEVILHNNACGIQITIRKLHGKHIHVNLCIMVLDCDLIIAVMFHSMPWLQCGIS